MSRFRCGAEARSTESWRGSAVCRMCNEKEESMDHLVECFPVEGSRNGKDLWCKDSGRERMDVELRSGKEPQNVVRINF